MAKGKRLTPQQIREQEEAAAAALAAAEESDTNPVVPTNDVFGGIGDTPKNEIKEDPAEKELTRFEDIRNYYEAYTGGKQSTFYLPEELLRKLKAKLSEEDMSITDKIKSLLLTYYFEDKELKDSYQKRPK
ncbi:hypothetical protein CI088_01455 [Enterococcus plantarum]|uniref:Uncharacterized protein n=1 Tax=Enterococcus plantarum TaxID=1077675 RepID=A0A2W3ZTH7_9ENTE|nr:hypothetical protein [Enterococcus plantarum]PZL77494.1 hypothetical protein CI088_01455 [Enterococcus plantarum]